MRRPSFWSSAFCRRTRRTIHDPGRIRPSTPPPMSLSLDIPAMPGVIRKLTVMLQSEDMNTSALADLVATDMALAAALMQAVKSARLGLRTPPRSASGTG